MNTYATNKETDYLKEIAMIAAIIADNFMKPIYAHCQRNGSGYIAALDEIQAYATDFYEKNQDVDWEEEIWDDYVISWTEKTLRAAEVIGEGSTNDERCLQNGYFIVSQLHDLRQQGYDPSGLTDKQMVEIASKMEEFATNTGDFWDGLESIASDLKVPKMAEESEV